MDLRLSAKSQDTWLDAIKSWGPQHQMTMAYEECGELIQAIAHYERGRCGIENVIEEFADVFVCAGQVIHDAHDDPDLSTAQVMEKAIRNAFNKLQLKLDQNDKNFSEDR